MSWLKGYLQLEEEITTIEWDVKRSRVELVRWQQNGDLFNKNKLETALVHQQRLTQEVHQLEQVLREKKNLVEELVKRIDSFEGIDHKILKMKYVDGMTLETIAEDLNYSASYIYKKHAEIIRMIKYAAKNSG